MIDVLSSPKKNYDLLALEEIERIKEAGTRPSLLMHVCCGPCSCYPLTMLCPVFDLTLYYNNSNIYPREEFDRRLEELKKLIVDVKADYGFDVKLVEAPYDETYEAFLAQYANEKEGGPRCKLCYERRMGEAYDYAEAHNYDYFCTVMTRLMHDLEEKYDYPVDVEFACNFRPDREYKINLLQCRPLQTRGIGAQGVKPKVRDYFFRINGNFMGGNVALPVRYIIKVDVESYLDLPEQKKYHVARCIGRLNALLRGEHTVLMGPGRWGTTTPSLGVPVNYTEVSHFDCMCELAYSSHGLRPELSYGSHFFQDLVEAGTFYTALYRGEAGCEFNDALFETYDNCYRALLGDEAEADMERVIRVYDTEGHAILYSEIASQECFLAKI